MDQLLELYEGSDSFLIPLLENILFFHSTGLISCFQKTLGLNFDVATN